MTDEKREMFRYLVWFNLFIGFYNLYLYSIGGDFVLNFIIGSLNIGAWVFNRHI